jgi:hypothetical protein
MLCDPQDKIVALKAGFSLCVSIKSRRVTNATRKKSEQNFNIVLFARTEMVRVVLPKNAPAPDRKVGSEAARRLWRCNKLPRHYLTAA